MPALKSNRWLTVSAVLIALLVLYPLSVGPVTWVTDSIDPSHGTIWKASLYYRTPLRWIATKSDKFDWYARWISWPDGPDDLRPR